MSIACVRSLVLALAALPILAACGGGGGSPAVFTPIAPGPTGPTGPTGPILFDVREWTVGAGPVRVAVGDVNGDGKADMAVLRSKSSSVGIYLGSGIRAQAPVGSHHALVWDTSTDLALADLDGDGVLDLVVAGGSERKVAVFRGDPVHRGQIFADTAWEILAFASRVAVGDVNGDGRADIVCLDETTGQVRLLRQDPNQSMTFVLGNDPPVVGACTGLILVDLDRDGALDVVTSNGGGSYFVCYTVNGAVQWVPQQVGLPTGRGIAVGDVNRDGWPDVVVTRMGSTGVGDGVVAMLQVPSAPRGFMSVPSASGIAIEEEGIQIADLDRDGFPDLCINPLDPNMGRGAVMFGSPVTRGAFAATTITVTNEGRDRLRVVPTAQTTGRGVPTSRLDLDGDGHEDVVLQDETGDSLVIGFVVDRDPPDPITLREAFHLPGTGAPLRGVAVADLDRDGAVDLAEGGDGEVRLRWGDPASPGTFDAPTSVPLLSSCRDVIVGDWNGDGRPDLAIGDTFTNSILVLLQDPATARSFALAGAISSPGTLSSVAVGDLNGDGHLDVTASSPLGGGAQFFWFGDGNGAFPGFDSRLTGVALPREMDLADLDGDGDLDIALASDFDLPVTLLFLGPGAPPQASIPLLRGLRVAAGDVNGDGRLDLVASGPSGVSVALQSAVQRGRFLAAFALGTEPATGLAIGDLDRDGRLDVAWNEPLAGRVRVAAGDVNGDGVEVVSRSNGLPSPLAVETFVLEADLDGDGWAEIVLAHPLGIGWPGSLDVFTSR